MLVGGLEREFSDFPYIGDKSSSQLTNSSFFRGVGGSTTNQWVPGVSFDPPWQCQVYVVHEDFFRQWQRSSWAYEGRGAHKRSSAKRVNEQSLFALCYRTAVAKGIAVGLCIGAASATATGMEPEPRIAPRAGRWSDYMCNLGLDTSDMKHPPSMVPRAWFHPLHPPRFLEHVQGLRSQINAPWGLTEIPFFQIILHHLFSTGIMYRTWTLSVISSYTPHPTTIKHHW